LIDAGADPNVLVYGDSRPLHIVSSPQVIRVLLAGGADARAVTSGGQTTLIHLAGRHPLGDRALIESLKLLVDAGAGVKAADWRGKTLLHSAARYSAALIRAALDMGADPRSIDKAGCTALHALSEWVYSPGDGVGILISAGIPVDARNAKGETALHLSESPAVAKLLLAAGSDPRSVDASGRTALHHAASRARGSRGEEDAKQSLAVGSMLVDAGASAVCRDLNGVTPLHLAVGVDMVDWLLENGSDPHAVDASGSTVLHHLAANRKWGVGKRECVSRLLQAGADPRAVDAGGRTARDLLMEGFQDAEVRGLLDRAVLGGG
jgi:ankyrin repeat protein